MLKSLLYLILFFNSSITFSQTWMDSGAKWTFDYWNVGEYGTYRSEYLSDSIFEGKNCQMIKQTKYAYGGPNPGINEMGNVFMYASNDSVFYWKNDQFFLLYDFGAEIGDTWVFSIDTMDEACQDTAIVQVMNVGTTTINGFLLRTLTLQTISNSFSGISGVVTERFGSPTGTSFGFLPGYQGCPESEVSYDVDLLTFRCYEDDNFPSYNPTNLDCDTLTLDLIEDIDLAQFHLFPNPSNHFLSVTDQNNSIKRISLVDLTGSEVFTISKNETIDVSSLKSGVYFVEIETKYAIKINKIFVKI